MGVEIDRTEFTAEDYSNFQQRLERNLLALQHLLQKKGFGEGKASIGAELEMYLVDKQGLPALVNQEVLDDAGDASLTVELNRYNLEYNLDPYLLDQQALLSTEQAITAKLNALQKVAEGHAARIAMVGILPTLTRQHFGPPCMTDRRRYHALVNQLLQERGSDFVVDINGDDPLRLQMTDVTLEGANTSFQLHYRVSPGDFVDTYNAMQLATPLVLAIAGNSPGLFGNMLWEETRIPLFKQSIDTRITDRYKWHSPARVNFGNGWLRDSVFNLFLEAVRLYPALLPVCSDEDPLEIIQNEAIPALHELRLQQSSVWTWNRPVFDDADGGHLRIEMRALPAGPTAIDMVANAALMLGLTEHIRSNIDLLLPAIPFNLAEYNFYRAAQHGLQAKLVWPSPRQNSCKEQAVDEILAALLPGVADALSGLGLAKKEVERYVAVIEGRLVTGQTGARWQRQSVAALEEKHSRQDSLHRMLESMIENSASNKPVADWKVASSL